MKKIAVIFKGNDKFVLLKKKIAFTLAEVLITLSILGVVAAISIPNIIQQYQKRLNITKLQKAYSVLETAATNIAVNSGCLNRDVACTGLLNDADFVNKFIELSGMKYSKIWSSNFNAYNQITGNRHADFVERMIIAKDGIGYKVFRGNVRANGTDYSSIIIHVFTEPNLITRGGLTYDSENHPYSKRTIVGRNVFGFAIWDTFKVEPVLRVNAGEGSYYPLSTYPNADTYCNPKSTNTDVKYSGFGCTAKIIKDGWKMNY